MPATSSRSARDRRRTGAVTLADVARQAGVSLATASRALNGGSRVVNDELRDRVLQAAERLQYVSHGPAQALARASTSVVGLIVHDVRDPYFSGIAAGAMRVAREENLMVMLASTFRDHELELDYVSRLRVQRARAILLVGSGTTSRGFTRRLRGLLDDFERRGGRAACVSHHGVPIDAVLPDNRGGGVMAAQHLLSLGHRKIGVIAGPAELVTVRHRLEGARRALSDAGVSLPDRAVVEGDFSREGGEAAMARLLDQMAGVTAVFALNDLMARGALSALAAASRRVPDDVSVIGFDDLPVAVDTSPRLTTIKLPLEEIGERAMRLVLAEPERGGKRRTERIPVELVERESTAPAAGRPKRGR